MSDENGDFVSPALSAALAMHEMYETLIEAGFTQKEALYIVAEMVRGAGS